jgi:hypothetical protein
MRFKPVSIGVLSGCFQQFLITGLGLSQIILEGESDERNSLTFVKLGLEFDPMKT